MQESTKDKVRDILGEERTFQDAARKALFIYNPNILELSDEEKNSKGRKILIAAFGKAAYERALERYRLAEARIKFCSIVANGESTYHLRLLKDKKGLPKNLSLSRLFPGLAAKERQEAKDALEQKGVVFNGQSVAGFQR